MLSIIVAVANNNVIGKNNKLLWNIPEDLKRFKEITTGKKIIMGRKTFESIGRILPNRFHIILSREKNFDIKDKNVLIINDLEKLKEYIDSEEECFVIGGEAIYKLLMPYTKKIYLTKINANYDGDTFFPDINKETWEKIEIKKGIKNEDNPYDYEYITYKRK